MAETLQTRLVEKFMQRIREYLTEYSVMCWDEYTACKQDACKHGAWPHEPCSECDSAAEQYLRRQWGEDDDDGRTG